MVNHVNFIWNIAESLRGPFKPSEYGSVVLPFTVLRRLDAVLTETKPKVANVAKATETMPDVLRHLRLTEAAGHQFYNTSTFDFAKLVADPQDLRANFAAYLAGFSENVRDIFERFEFEKTLNKLAEKNKLYSVTEKFAQADFHPTAVSNIEMGLIFEELIRWANERSNETAGDHYTPREVIALMVQLLFALDDDALSKSGVVRSIYDPTAGTGGMLSVADEFLRKMNPDIQLNLYGQDYNDASYAICKADMVIKGQDVDNIALGDTLTEDAFDEKKFDYGLSNPPFGVDWKDQRAYVDEEHARLGFNGRFGPGTPAVSDGAMLFLLHLVSKMRKQEDGGSRMAIVLNGSPLFSGGAGGGESNIRKWLLDNDLVEAIIGLPKDMFYNTGISTYIWVLTNRKDDDRKGRVQLIDGREMFTKLRKGLGSKRNELSPKNIETIVGLYSTFEGGEHSKIFRNEEFLYRTITVERPLKLNWQATAERISAVFAAKAVQKLKEPDADALRAALNRLGSETVWKNRGEFQKALKDAAKLEGFALAAPLLKTVTNELGEQDDTADVCTDAKGKPEPDASLRDTENVPWGEDVDAYVAREVLPYADDAWVDHAKTKEGAEIPFTRHFYRYIPPRPLEEIDRDLDAVMDQLRAMLVEVER
ncbi:type I restriction enzyme M protein [Microbacterium keratanolyticum]|uniref:site-specific DNA-methyltransferase (adenine-specific) n=1 Tax=Microbacterium keratanolyticum TaxID=67574 RepID=A0A9W6HS96_9MICO|nr:class I SAM-dependent DNA methyltransferase [Microbacterium keratanolyticum]MBM7469046.1 type I restriction enzyme M protein [Microbacterium keratanolyticum]GLK01125.1 DNA methyltransferase [Microbacterium keratanolyticum]